MTEKMLKVAILFIFLNATTLVIAQKSDSVTESLFSNTVDITISETSILTVEGLLDSATATNGTVALSGNLNVTTNSEDFCPQQFDGNNLTQSQLINALTDPCRYDRLERPRPIGNGTVSDLPVEVFVRSYIYILQNLESSNLQFKMQGLLQLRYNDNRLAFNTIAPKKTNPIMGEAELRSLIWVPHIFLSNERDSSVLGTNEKDILTSISPDGTVIISSRIQATLFCWMDLRKFPFDEQECTTVFESWMFNSSELMLHWEQKSPLAFDPEMHLTEYILQNSWINESIITADLTDLRHGAFAGNYSSLNFTVHLTREVGYYVMDYFLPSMMIVAISWVSFWLQADQTPARTTLGTSTLLSFITLSSSQDNNLPKVSYIKISEVWFLGCTAFIFGSLVEFAFVNTIWRRKRNLELKKINSKHILKSTLTPSMKRHKMNQSNPNLNEVKENNTIFLSPDNAKTVETPENNFNSNSSLSTCISIEDNADVSNSGQVEEKKPRPTMTPHEVSLWIDRKARFVFPLLFLLFNALFWTFVYCL